MIILCITFKSIFWKLENIFLGASARLYSPLPRVSATGLAGLRRGVLQVQVLSRDWVIYWSNLYFQIWQLFNWNWLKLLVKPSNYLPKLFLKMLFHFSFGAFDTNCYFVCLSVCPFVSHKRQNAKPIGKILLNPRTFFVIVLYFTKRRCSQTEPKLKVEIEDGAWKPSTV